MEDITRGVTEARNALFSPTTAISIAPPGAEHDDRAFYSTCIAAVLEVSAGGTEEEEEGYEDLENKQQRHKQQQRHKATAAGVAGRQ